jgi:hypothetical protein
VVIVSQVGEVEGLSLSEIRRSRASTSFGEEGGTAKYLQPADIRPMIILSNAGTSLCKNARRIRSRLRSMSDHSECSSRIRFFASSRVKRLSPTSAAEATFSTPFGNGGMPAALTGKPYRAPRLRVTVFLSRQPEESCGTLGRDRIRWGLDRFSYADAAASLFS